MYKGQHQKAEDIQLCLVYKAFGDPHRMFDNLI